VTCPEGERCDGGTCVPDGGGGGGGAGGGAASGGGGAGGATSTSTATGSGGEAGGTSEATTSSAGGESDSNAWGLPTGGGGLRCATSDTRDTNATDDTSHAWFSLGTLAAMLFRRKKRTPHGDASRPGGAR
jgi:hypothetical protein